MLIHYRHPRGYPLQSTPRRELIHKDSRVHYKNTRALREAIILPMASILRPRLHHEAYQHSQITANTLHILHQAAIHPPCPPAPLQPMDRTVEVFHSQWAHFLYPVHQHTLITFARPVIPRGNPFLVNRWFIDTQQESVQTQTGRTGSHL